MTETRQYALTDDPLLDPKFLTCLILEIILEMMISEVHLIISVWDEGARENAYEAACVP